MYQILLANPCNYTTVCILNSDLCQRFDGEIKEMKNANVFLHHLKPNGPGLNFRPVFSDSTLNLILPLKSGSENNAEIQFISQNCTLNNLEEGKMYLFPSEVTHR